MNRDIIILLIINSLLAIPTVYTIGQSIHIPQNKAAIENFTLNEDDTLRYAHHYLYERAYQVIADMLTDKRSVDMAEAVFAVENSFYDGALNHKAYFEAIRRLTDGVTAMASSPENKAPSRDMALNYAIYNLYTQPCPLNNYHPYQYDIESLFTDGGYAGGMVHNLLTTGHGTCRSLPYLYKIIADRVGARAYLANAPLHTYIRHQDSMGRWWNFETTTGTYSRSSFIMDSYHITEEGIRSGLYMTNLTDKENIVQLLYDLLCIYEHKTGFYSNAFVRKCYTLGLRYHYADNLHKWKINDLKYQLDKEAWLRGLRSEEEVCRDRKLAPKYNHIQELRAEFQRMGYHEFTKEEYLQKYQEVIDYMQRNNIPIPGQKN